MKAPKVVNTLYLCLLQEADADADSEDRCVGGQSGKKRFERFYL